MAACVNDALPEEPLVTAVVPAFNARATLAETLESVAAQTYRNLEILIVDDGSTDETPVIAAAFCAADPRARLILKENGGVASARNHGISEARGAWVAPVDADDLWHPAKIEKQVAAALAAPSPPGFVYCWFRLIDGESSVIGSGERWTVDGPALKRLAYRNFVGNGSALLLSREAALAAGAYDEGLRACGAEGCEDIALQLEVARRHPVAAVPEYLVGYRFHAGSMSRNGDRMFRSWQSVLGRLEREEKRIPAEVLRWNLGIRYLNRAEALALRGERLAGLGSLGRALMLDPARTGLHLLYRGARLVARLLRGRRPRPEPVAFGAADSRAVLAADPDALQRFERLLLRFDEGRMARLAALERG